MTPRIKTMPQPSRRGPTIAAGFARALLELAVSKGAGRDALCRQSGIDPAQLADQDNRVPLARYIALMRAGQALCNDPALALHFGEAFDMTELSIVGLIGEACETMLDALTQVNRYTRLIVEVDGVAAGDRFVRMCIEGRSWLVDTRRDPNDFPELTESSFARMVCGARRFTGNPLFTAVHVTHPAPAYRSEYDRIFQVPVTFVSDRNALLLDERSWRAANARRPSRYVFGLLSERAEALLRDLLKSGTVRAEVESGLMTILHTGEASLNAMALRMGLSPQQLYRKLKAEGVTFEKVLDDLRHKVALHYLAGGKVSVNETAYLVGYSDPAAFSRAFKRWTGLSPRAARAG